jgi:diguanylate cyclase (GGDEF)-like protein
MLLSLKRKKIFNFFIVLGFVMGFIYLYISIQRYIEPLKEEIIEVATSDIVEIANDVAHKVTEMVPTENFIHDIVLDKVVQKNVENILETLQTEHIQYVYLIFKTRHKYRYLLDVSVKDRAVPLENFEPINEGEWDRVYGTKEAKLIYHKDGVNLGFTYLQPLIIKNQTKAILAIDYARNKLDVIEQLEQKLEWIALFLFGAGLIFLIGMMIQTYRTIFLKEKMYTDELTKLSNRHYLKSAEEFIEINSYFILLIDIDLFKRINDSYGHHAGDYVLSEFAQLLQSFRKKRDILVRYGGEEFLFLLHKSKQGSVEDFANHIRQSIQAYPFRYEGIRIPISISIGLNFNETLVNKFSEAIHQADLALYEAKRTGRNKVVIAREHLKGNIGADEVRQAIDKSLFVCEYQSIVHLKTHEVSHYESLVRIQSHDQLLYPGSFLSSIENTFLYTQMTKIIFYKNLGLLKEQDHLRVSLNFTPEDLLDESIMEMLLNEKEYAHRILIEILETQTVSYNLINESIQTLKKVGYKICIDDFGSGYSNFMHLLQMDIDYLKLDANLILGIAENPKNYIIVESIVLICKKSNIKVIAEYVENEVILDYLLKLDIDYGQGFYFSKPQKIENFV